MAAPTSWPPGSGRSSGRSQASRGKPPNDRGGSGRLLRAAEEPAPPLPVRRPHHGPPPHEGAHGWGFRAGSGEHAANFRRSGRCRGSGAVADRLIAAYKNVAAAQRPRLWFTYHVYYKAPDWIGPRVSDALRIPYVAAEGSRAGKRAGGPWAIGHAGAEAALDRAAAIFVMTEADREALEQARPAAQRLIELPPFIDMNEWHAVNPP